MPPLPPRDSAQSATIVCRYAELWRLRYDTARSRASVRAEDRAYDA